MLEYLLDKVLFKVHKAVLDKNTPHRAKEKSPQIKMKILWHSKNCDGTDYSVCYNAYKLTDAITQSLYLGALMNAHFKNGVHISTQAKICLKYVHCPLQCKAVDGDPLSGSIKMVLPEWHV